MKTTQATVLDKALVKRKADAVVTAIDDLVNYVEENAVEGDPIWDKVSRWVGAAGGDKPQDMYDAAMAVSRLMRRD